MLRTFTDDSFGNSVIFPTNRFFKTDFPGANGSFREGQFRMTQSILNTLASDQKTIQLIEAGVGIGKSYAYLVPILFAKKHTPDLSIIVSTGTIALQEQLIGDIRTLATMLHLPGGIGPVLAKGQTHFLCKRRAYHAYEDEVPQWLNNVDSLSLTGDRKEIERCANNTFSDKTWRRLHVNNSCDKKRCEMYHQCGYMKLRSQMRDSRNIVVTNHDQLIQDRRNVANDRTPIFHFTLTGRAIRDIVVLDEAHLLEEKARNAETLHYCLDDMHRAIASARHRLRDPSLRSEAAEVQFRLFALLDQMYEWIYTDCIKKETIIRTKSSDYPQRFSIGEPPMANSVREKIATLDTLVQMDDSQRPLHESDDDAEYLLDFLSDMLHSTRFAPNISGEVVGGRGGGNPFDDSSDYIYWAEITNRQQHTLALNWC